MSNNIISVTDLSKSYPERPVLNRVTFGIDAGDHLGVIGFNGAGKSTLLGLLAGEIEPDSGSIVTRRGVAVAHLSQSPEIAAGLTVGDIAGQSHTTLTYLDRLGLTDHGRVVDELSGGQQRRAALAITLAEDSDVLILDEPTNHLDIDTIDWMEDELARRAQTVVFVTHDRYLLDRLATRIVEVEGGDVYSHAGSYQEYLTAREVRRSHAERSERRRRNLAAVELEWLRRSPKARTSKSKARVTRATDLQMAAESLDRTELAFELPSPRLGDKVVDLKEASVSFSGDQVIEPTTWHLTKGARIGIVGPNGSGKTTLLRLLGGRLQPSTGEVDVGDTVIAGWYGQEPEHLDPTIRVLDVVRSEAEQTRLTSGVTVSAGQLLERLGFPSSQHSTLVGDLSGGERRRLELLRVLAGAPNLLLFDEPTNDLDLETLGSLESLLDTWPGAMVTASHDRYFLERVCRDILSIETDGSIRHHPGGYSAYLSGRDSGTVAKGASSRSIKDTAGYIDRLSYKEQREFDRLGTSIAELTSRLAGLDEEIRSAGSEWQEVQRLVDQRDELAAALATAEDRWLTLSERA